MECSCFGCWKYLLHIQIEETIQSSCDTDGFNVQRDIVDTFAKGKFVDINISKKSYLFFSGFL